MSLHYLLDGYNIIHQAPALMQGSLEERRARLVRWLNIERPQGSARNRVTVIFDGTIANISSPDYRSNRGGTIANISSPDYRSNRGGTIANISSPSGGGHGDVQVVFSQGQNADACIKSMVECSKNPQVLVVVSDDKDIRLYVRALGARISSVREFAAGLFRRTPKTPRARSKTDGDGGKHISLTQAHQINTELEKIWISNDPR